MPRINPAAKRGFTLVETLVAITVLVVVIAGPLYAVNKSLMASYAARDKLIATALAQEGVEYVRSVRDNNYLYNAKNVTPRTWLNGLDGTASTPNCFTGQCTVDQGQQTIAQCSGACAPLRLSSSNVYTQTVNAAYPLTKFTRTVQVAPVPTSATSATATEVTVTVTVSWTTLRVPYTVTVVEHLNNWL